MLESLGNVNMGKVSDNDFKESNSITIIREILEKNKRIKVRAQEADKIPNLDGKLMILDNNSMERITIDIQVKTLPTNYKITYPYKYSCDTKVFNVVINNVTFNPVVLLLVDKNDKKIFWKYISKEYTESLNIGTQKDKTINFDNNDIYDEKKFTSFMIKIFKKIGIIIERGSNPYLFIEQDVLYNDELQKEVDRLNNKFDNELISMKRLLFPRVWKFGVAYREYGNGLCALGIYAILKGENDTLIRNYDIENEGYLNSVFSGRKGANFISENIDKWIGKVITHYFNILGLNPQFLPNIVLNEIVYVFLDRLAADIRYLQGDDMVYKNNSESIETVIRYYDGLKTFHYRLVKEIPMSNYAKALLNVYNIYGERFLLFNPLIKPSGEEYDLLIDSIKSPRNLPCEIKFISSYIEIPLFEMALEELKKRRITKVERVWKPRKWKLYKDEQRKSNLNDKAHGFIVGDLYQNLNKFFANFGYIYLQTYREYIGSHSRFKICGKFIVTYNIYEPYKYHLFYDKSDTFNISIEELCEKDAIRKYDNTYCQSFSGKNIDLIFTEKMPFYNYLKIFINIGMALAYKEDLGLDRGTGEFGIIKDMPIIKEYLLSNK